VKLKFLKNGVGMPRAVAHACNPSYSGGRDQEDRSSKPAQANSSRDPISKKPITKKGLVEWLIGVGPDCKKKKKKKCVGAGGIAQVVESALQA
jgi:hypothetical protein